jgi:anti-sigma factor RsiW
MRDRLPDLLHEQLEESARAEVMAHVSGCADCRAELALLRQMRVSLSSGIVAIDTAGIAKVVVSRTASGGVTGVRRGRWTDWRLAAAAAVLIVAGGASAVMWHARRDVPNGAVPAAQPVIAATPGMDSTTRSPSPVAVNVPPRASRTEPSVPKASAELAAAGDVSELSESDLRTLLRDLDTLEAVPSTEPEPVTVRVNLPERGGTD